MKQMSLVDALNPAETQPLAARMRPRTLEEFVGQEHLVGEGKILRQMIERDQIPSMILWGPPGVGKTTLANVVANLTQAEFVNFSAVTSGIKEIKEIMARAEAGRRVGLRTVLFVDEIHRFNKAQQDAFLPYVEQGSIILIGATTENPSFEVNSALLSRSKVFVLKALGEDDLVKLLRRALTEERGFGSLAVDVADDTLRKIAVYANGDARHALGTLEAAVSNAEPRGDRLVISDEVLAQCIGRKALMYDKHGEEHYNVISALHKSMRNSDPDAAVYWLARMLEGGEDPLYIARRCVRFASEDVGLADPNALLAEVERDGGGLPARGVGRADADGRARAAQHPQRAHAAHEGARLRQGLHLRARHRREDRADVVPARIAGGPSLLRAVRPRDGSALQGAARRRPRLARRAHGRPAVRVGGLRARPEKGGAAAGKVKTPWRDWTRCDIIRT